MFSSRGHFRTFQCPRKAECLLPACWFSHEDTTSPDASVTAAYDPFTAGIPDSPPAKRRRIGESSDEPPELRPPTTMRAISPPLQQKISAKPSRIGDNSSLPGSREVHEFHHANDRDGSPSQSPKIFQSTSSNPQSAQTGEPITGSSAPQIINRPMKSVSTRPSEGDAQIPKSMGRPVTPPPRTAIRNPINNSTSSQTKHEVLRPRLLAKGPDWQSRDTLLKVLHKTVVTRNNEIIRRVKGGEKTLAVARLLPHEVITLALDEEIDLARKYGAGVYQNVMKQRIHAISKLTIEQWMALLIEKVVRVKDLNERKSEVSQTVEHQSAAITQTETEVIRGLGKEEEVQILRKLQQPLDKLQAHGYITQTPTPDDIRQAKETLQASGGWEKCDRCGSRFQVFPGRNDEGHLTSGGRCRYHWAKAGTGLLNRVDRNTGGKEAKHGCCNQSIGSTGCTESDVHVFNDKDPKRLASIWQWEETPENKRPMQAVSFDCEMCYTTLGMEVVRVTAVSWPHNHTLLDILVRPYGEILDLNTRFSGVSRKMYAEAPVHEDGDSIKLGVTSKVGSPEIARRLLFDIITPDTPLIGHAIENDLNTLRIIHPFVIDTVLLYPHKRGLPMRASLRNLAFEHLDGRRIQTGADMGHDSKEDAIATSDLVTKAVRVRWGVMKADGWRFENGQLVKDNGDDSKL